MKILIVCQHFYPEIFRINDIACALSERGFDVSVLTGRPNYPSGKIFPGYEKFSKEPDIYPASADSASDDSVKNPIKIYRTNIILRGSNKIQLIFNYFDFWFKGNLRASRICKKEKFDLVFVYQLSPVFMTFPGIKVAEKQHIPIINYVLDLWPESLSEMTGIKKGPVFRLFSAISGKAYKKSDKILVTSPAFSDKIQKFGIKADKTEYWPQYAEDFYSEKTDSEAIGLPEGFKIIYAGNFGEAQGLECAIEAAKITSETAPDIKWIFMGGGRNEENLKTLSDTYGLTGKNVFFIGRKPPEQVPAYLKSCDAALLSLKDMKLLNMTVPAKLQSYMAAGMPVIASCGGEGASIVEASGCGICAAPGDYKMLANSAFEMYNKKTDEIEKYCENAKSYFSIHFSKEKLMDRLVEIFDGEIRKK